MKRFSSSESIVDTQNVKDIGRQMRLTTRLHLVARITLFSTMLLWVVIISVGLLAFYILSRKTGKSHIIQIAVLFAAGVFGSQILAGIAQTFGLWGLDTSHDLWAIGPLLEIMAAMPNSTSYFKPLASLVSHVQETDHIALTQSQRQALHKFISAYYQRAWNETRGIEYIKELRQQILDGLMYVIEIQLDTTAIPALQEFSSQATGRNKDKALTLLDKLLPLEAQQSASATLVRAAEEPTAELLHPAQAVEDNTAADTLIRPSQP